MIDYELTDLLIELEDIQQLNFLGMARGRQVAELLEFYKLPKHLYSLKQESLNEHEPDRSRRTIACFNFGLVTDELKGDFIECLYMVGFNPEFISEGLGEDIRDIAESLRQVIDKARTRRASELRKNPQKFRLIHG